MMVIMMVMDSSWDGSVWHILVMPTGTPGPSYPNYTSAYIRDLPEADTRLIESDGTASCCWC